MNCRVRILIVFTLLCLPVSLRAAEFVLSVNYNATLLYPALESKIKTAFESAGHTVAFSDALGGRGLTMAGEGMYDGDAFRIPFATANLTDLLKIPVVLAQIDAWIIGRPGLNITSLEDLKRYRMIPISGIKYYEKYSERDYPKTPAAQNIYSALNMLERGRGDYMIWVDIEQALLQKQNPNLKIHRYLSSPVDKLSAYTWIHKKHKSKLEGLTKAYQKVF